jgi:hypothetical protein
MFHFFQVIWTWFHDHEFVAVWFEGVALVLILFLDWREYRKQGADRAKQHEETVAQMNIMQSQADATRDNALAAKESAEAAKENAEASRLNADTAKAILELTISKERARLRVTLKPLNLYVGGFMAHSVEYTVQLYGPTEARIIESGATAEVTSTSNPSSPDAYPIPIVLPEVITPSTPVTQLTAFIMPNLKLDEAQIKSINARTAFVHFHGFIRYKDVFERERETKFRFIWTVTDLPTFGQGPYSLWMKSGAEGDNIET